MRKPRTVLASVGMFAGITAGLAALFTPTAQATGPVTDRPAQHTVAAPNPARDCTRVPADVRELCTWVSAQTPYAYVGKGGGLNQVAGGNLIVNEIAHSGLTKREMRSALRGHSNAYTKHVFNTRSIAVDLSSLARLCGTDGQFVVGFIDDDGRKGGSKSTRVEIDCP